MQQNEKADWLFVSAKWFLALMVSLWIGLPQTVKLLVGFMALDYLTGLTAAFIRKEVTSRAAINGLLRKFVALALCGAAHLASDHLISEKLGLGVDLGQVVALFYVTGELISIVENCNRAGVPIPPIITAALQKKPSQG